MRDTEKDVENVVSVFVLVVIAILFSFFVWMFFYVIPANRADAAVRQEQINTFYRAHSCKPEGYVAGRYNPIRTYRCDNGLYTVEDMK